MAFDPNFPDIWNACHASQVAPLIVKYTQGRCLDIGSGPGKVWPRCIGIDPAHQGGRPITDICADGTDLSMFGDNSVDGVFSSFLLHQFERSKVVQHAARVGPRDQAGRLHDAVCAIGDAGSQEGRRGC